MTSMCPSTCTSTRPCFRGRGKVAPVRHVETGALQDVVEGADDSGGTERLAPARRRAERQPGARSPRSATEPPVGASRSSGARPVTLREVDHTSVRGPVRRRPLRARRRDGVPVAARCTITAGLRPARVDVGGDDVTAGRHLMGQPAAIEPPPAPTSRHNHAGRDADLLELADRHLVIAGLQASEPLTRSARLRCQIRRSSCRWPPDVVRGLGPVSSGAARARIGCWRRIFSPSAS